MVDKFWDWEANNVILFQSTPLYPLKFPPVFSELFFLKKKWGIHSCLPPFVTQAHTPLLFINLLKSYHLQQNPNYFVHVSIGYKQRWP